MRERGLNILLPFYSPHSLSTVKLALLYGCAQFQRSDINVAQKDMKCADVINNMLLLFFFFFSFPNSVYYFKEITFNKILSFQSTRTPVTKDTSVQTIKMTKRERSLNYCPTLSNIKLLLIATFIFLLMKLL